MDLKVNNITFYGSYKLKTNKFQNRYTGIGNFHSNINLNPKQTFTEKLPNFSKLYIMRTLNNWVLIYKFIPKIPETVTLNLFQGLIY